LSQTDSAYTKETSLRPQQGDILQRVTYLHWRFVEATPLRPPFFQVVLPYIVVLTQDCDLEQDFTKRVEEEEELQDHFLHTALVCPAYPSQKFREGTHLDNWQVKMSKPEHYNSSIKGNMHKRYHRLSEDKETGVPELILDFKHYYAIPMDVLYELYASKHYFAHINELFREDLSQRFSYYLSRIGLPVFEASSKQKESERTDAE